MAHKKKKLMKKLSKMLRKDREASPEGRSTMNPDPFHPTADTAPIPEVTDAVLDEAAHKAAQLADGVAHHTIALATSAGEQTAAAAQEDHAAASPDKSAVAAGPAPAATADTPSGDAARAGDGARDAAPRAASVADPIVPSTADALGQYNAKVVEIVSTNLAATGSLFVALLGTKSLPDAVALNADHLRKQMDTLTTQGRELATLAQKMALAALQPFKSVIPRDR